MFYTLRREDNQWDYARNLDAALQIVLPFFAVLVAVLMVSRVPYPHVVNQVFSGQHSFGHLVALIFALVVIVMIRGYSVPLVCGAFVLWGPVSYAWQEAVQRRPHDEPMFLGSARARSDVHRTGRNACHHRIGCRRAARPSTRGARRATGSRCTRGR
jgi:hypothetical protein